MYTATGPLLEGVQLAQNVIKYLSTIASPRNQLAGKGEHRKGTSIGYFLQSFKRCECLSQQPCERFRDSTKLITSRYGALFLARIFSRTWNGTCEMLDLRIQDAQVCALLEHKQNAISMGQQKAILYLRLSFYFQQA